MRTLIFVTPIKFPALYTVTALHVGPISTANNARFSLGALGVFLITFAHKAFDTVPSKYGGHFTGDAAIGACRWLFFAA